MNAKDIRALRGELLKGAADNLERSLEMATVDQVERGKRWYGVAHGTCGLVSSLHEVGLSTVAGVVSALSPQMPWERNIAEAANLIADPDYRPPTYGLCLEKALAILGGQEPEPVLRGPKTVAFYRCLVDPVGSVSVAIDRHQIRLLYPDMDDQDRSKVLKHLYDDLVDVHVEQASKAGLIPHQVQAITWLVQREGR